LNKAEINSSHGYYSNYEDCMGDLPGRSFACVSATMIPVISAHPPSSDYGAFLRLENQFNVRCTAHGPFFARVR
jgi:hypothetical protein